MLGLIILWCLLLSIISACPPWTYSTNTDQEGTKCICGDDLGGTIHCGSHLSIVNCNCITYSRFNRTTVGRCIQMCELRKHFCSLYTQILSTDVVHLNQEVCGSYNRTGQLCGDCLKGYGPPVYSYSLVCAQCEESMFKYNLLKYLAIAYLPVTLMYLAFLLLNVSILSGIMVSYILICQIYTIPDVMEAVTAPSTDSHLGIKILISFYSLWNLDIFRPAYTPFCLHPALNTMHIVALDYLIALYPALLIFLTYLSVCAYDKYKHMFLYFCNGITLELDIRRSLIKTFATFFVLSYVKTMTTSFKLLSPAYVYSMDGSRSLYLFNDGEVPYFGKEHLPFGILAIIMVTLCNVIPVMLLLLYPTAFFQSRINSQFLTTFADAFQGCYRHHPKDCRYFSAVHFIFRAAVLLLLFLTKNSLFIALAGLSFLILTSVVIMIKPYQNNYINFAEIFLYMISALLYLCLFISYYYVRLIKPKLGDFKPILTIPANTFFLILTLYGLSLMTFMIVPKKFISLIISYYFKLKTFIFKFNKNVQK